MKTDIHFRSYLAEFFLERRIFETKVLEKLESCSITFFFFFFAVYEIMWENTVEWGGPQMTIWRMRIACWITKATNAHTGCVILIAFLLQQWLHERASMLRYTHIACIVKSGLIYNIWDSHDFYCKEDLYQNFGICLPKLQIFTQQSLVFTVWQVQCVAGCSAHRI
jgi:hypothetical protein